LRTQVPPGRCGRSRHPDRLEDRGLAAAVLADEEVHAAEIEFKVVDRLEVLDLESDHAARL